MNNLPCKKHLISTMAGCMAVDKGRHRKFPRLILQMVGNTKFIICILLSFRQSKREASIGKHWQLKLHPKTVYCFTDIEKTRFLLTSHSPVIFGGTGAVMFFSEKLSGRVSSNTRRRLNNILRAQHCIELREVKFSPGRASLSSTK